MCLAIPGKVIELTRDALGVANGRVSYGGVVKDVCFACVPETRLGDWVLVHVGFAISQLDETEARRVFELLSVIPRSGSDEESAVEMQIPRFARDDEE